MALGGRKLRWVLVKLCQLKEVDILLQLFTHIETLRGNTLANKQHATVTELKDKYSSRGYAQFKNITQTHHSPNRVEKNRSFLTCKLKPAAQKTTGHVETRGKTGENTQFAVFVSLCEAAGQMLLSGKVHKANVTALNCPLFWDYVVY